MGKKDGNKRKRNELQDDDIEEVDAELQAEIAAVMASRSERTGADEEEINGNSKEKNTYNKDGLIKSLENIDTVSLPFHETMQICEYDIAIQNENDDIEREMAFYNHTLLAVKLGRDKLNALSIPTRRPNDYFCENVKTDAHMAKIKDRLLVEEKRIEAFELRKNREQNRKFNKQVSELRKQEKVQERKAHNDEVTQIRRSSDKGEKEGRLNKILGGDKQAPTKSFKRQGLDKKYSFGAKDRKLAKMSDKKSLNDLSDFNPRGGKMVRREKTSGGGTKGKFGGSSGGGDSASFKRGRGGGKGGDKKKGTNRPGKDARTKKRAGN